MKQCDPLKKNKTGFQKKSEESWKRFIVVSLFLRVTLSFLALSPALPTPPHPSFLSLYLSLSLTHYFPSLSLSPTLPSSFLLSSSLHSPSPLPLLFHIIFFNNIFYSLFLIQWSLFYRPPVIARPPVYHYNDLLLLFVSLYKYFSLNMCQLYRTINCL